MAIVPIPSIRDLHPVPNNNMEEPDFNVAAEGFTGKMPGWADDVTAVGEAARTNAEHAGEAATAAGSSASTANQRAADANTSAITANEKAGIATTAASSAAASNAAIQKLYLGLKAAPPTTDNDGQPLQDGAWYTNSTTGFWYWRKDGSWVVGVGDLNAVDWGSQVINKPTTLSGYGIEDAVKEEDFTFAKLGSKPTTVDGYGITDAVKLSGGTMTGILGSIGINFGSSVAAAANNVTRHLNLYGGSFGLSITSSRLNYVSNAAHVFMTGATDTVTISNAGTITAIGNLTANSDERLKEDWERLPPDFLKRLSGLKAGTYRRKDLNERQAGISAQELQAILPEAVMVAGDEQGTLSVAYGNAAMVACVVLAQKVTELERRIEALESSGGGK